MKKILRRILNSLESDYIFVSYPKSGRTWLRMQIGLYLAECLNENEGVFDELLSDPLRTNEISNALGMGSILWDHAGSELIEKYAIRKAKYRKFVMGNKKKCFLIRDPKDVMVSSYFQATKRINVFEGDISSFIRDKNYGIYRWIYLHNTWFKDIKGNKFTKVIRYEDMKENSLGILAFILSDIGIKYLNNDFLLKAIEGAKFEKMKKIEKRESIDSKKLKPGDKDDPESYKVRKGKVGDYREYLNDSDLNFIIKALEQNNCRVYFEFYE